MGLDLLLLIVGLALACLTLSDVFETVVVPGGSRASLRVAARFGAVLLPIWKKVRGRRRGISGGFAPVVLVGSFVIWVSLLALAFGLMAYGARRHFEPPLRSLAEGIYLMGSSIVTMGLSGQAATGFARWVAVAAGFCGIAVITMAVTYLLQVQTSISQRDIGIIKLNTSAGNPPSALTLLEKFGAIYNRRELRELLTESRNWCATVRQSHSTHPTLIYFQSVGVGSGWPAAVGAMLDTALLAQHCIDDDDLYGPAVLLRQEGLGMIRELARVAGVHPVQVSETPAELEQAANRLATSGYRMRSNIDFSAMSSQRFEHSAYVKALADHLGKQPAILVRND